MDVEEFDYGLPEELIAQEPLPERDASRLLVLPRERGQAEHRMVRDLPAVLRPDDLLVVNDARVIPARVRGRKEGTGGNVELLLVEPLGGTDWLALSRSSKPLRAGTAVEAHGARLQILESRGEGEVVVRLPAEGEELWRYLDEAGEMPLPPYIDRPASAADRERYQTIFARARGGRRAHRRTPLHPAPDRRAAQPRRPCRADHAPRRTGDLPAGARSQGRGPPHAPRALPRARRDGGGGERGARPGGGGGHHLAAHAGSRARRRGAP